MPSYRDRRSQALDRFRGGAAVIPSARQLIRSNDTTFPFRQDSDFFYLTGFEEPDAMLVLAPEHAEHRTVLFLRPRDRDREIWDGERLGVERACERLGVDKAYDIAELDARLPEYLAGAATLHYRFGEDEARDRTLHAALEAARAKTRRKGRAPSVFADPGAVLHAMRLVKSDEELATMRAAAAITRDGHVAAMRATRPGLYEYEIAAEIEFRYARRGAKSAYEAIVASGERATTLHYVENRARLAEGELLLVDSGCELECYATDVTRTWPVGGRFSAEQRAVYDVVLRAQEAAIACVRPGQPRTAFHEAAVRVTTEGLIELGILTGSVDENVERESYKPYFMHGTGHWLGLDVHDVGALRDDRDEPVVLRPGMITTIEPGLYFRRDAECDDRWKGIGVRIEDDILVTADGCENLTAAIPKQPHELEELSGADARTGVA